MCAARRVWCCVCRATAVPFSAGKWIRVGIYQCAWNTGLRSPWRIDEEWEAA